MGEAGKLFIYSGSWLPWPKREITLAFTGTNIHCYIFCDSYWIHLPTR